MPRGLGLTLGEHARTGRNNFDLFRRVSDHPKHLEHRHRTRGNDKKERESQVGVKTTPPTEDDFKETNS